MRPSVTDTTLLFPFLRRQSDAPPTQEDTVLSAESGESITDRAVVPIDIREIAQDIKLWNSFKFVRPTQAEVDKYFKSFLQIQHPNGTDIICKTSVLEVYVADSLSTMRHRRWTGTHNHQRPPSHRLVYTFIDNDSSRAVLDDKSFQIIRRGDGIVNSLQHHIGIIVQIGTQLCWYDHAETLPPPLTTPLLLEKCQIHNVSAAEVFGVGHYLWLSTFGLS